MAVLVGGVICLVDSVNERDLNLLTSRAVFRTARVVGRCGVCCISRCLHALLSGGDFLEGHSASVSSRGRIEAIQVL